MATGVPPAGVCSGKITLRAALGHRDRFAVKGEGDLLPLPATEPALPLTVQLVRTDDPSQCWGSSITKLR